MKKFIYTALISCSLFSLNAFAKCHGTMCHYYVGEKIGCAGSGAFKNLKHDANKRYKNGVKDVKEHIWPSNKPGHKKCAITFKIKGSS